MTLCAEYHGDWEIGRIISYRVDREQGWASIIRSCKETDDATPEDDIGC